MRTSGLKGTHKDKGPEEGCSCVPKDEQDGQHAWSGDRSERQGKPHRLDPPSFRQEPLEVWSRRVKPSDFALRKPLSWLGGERVTQRQVGRQEAQAITRV